MSHESDSQAQTNPNDDVDRLAPLTKVLTDINGGRVLFWSMVVIAGYMFLTAQQFSSEVRLFPQLAAGVVLVAGTLKGATTVLNQKFDFDFGHDPERQGDTETETPGIGDEADKSQSLTPVLVLGTLITSYVVLGYIVGLLWVTPLFVVSYMRYTDQTWLRTVIFTVVLTAVAYGFMILMNLDLATGAI
jgi:hypothetical protein